MTQLEFSWASAAAPAWRSIRNGHDRASRKFGTWEHWSGWRVVHCGHPTALWPYYLEHPDVEHIVVSCLRRGFVTLNVARQVAEGFGGGRVSCNARL